MRTVYQYRPVRFRKIKSLCLTLFLLILSFMAGAVAERTAHFIQDVIAVAPVALDEVKEFFSDKLIVDFETAAEQFKWTTVILLSIMCEQASSLIRGP